MGDVVGFRDGDLWSISRLAESFGMARRTVSSRLVGVEPAGERNGNPVYHIKDASKALWQVNRAGGGTTLDLDQFPEARKAWYQSENERLKFEQNIGQLIPATDVHRTMAMMVKTIAAGIDSIPDILERDAGLDPQVIELVIPLLDGMREATADKMREAVRDEFKDEEDQE